MADIKAQAQGLDPNVSARDMTKMVVVNAAKKDKIGKDMKNLTE